MLSPVAQVEAAVTRPRGVMTSESTGSVATAARVVTFSTAAASSTRSRYVGVCLTGELLPPQTLLHASQRQIPERLTTTSTHVTVLMSRHDDLWCSAPRRPTLPFAQLRSVCAFFRNVSYVYYKMLLSFTLARFTVYKTASSTYAVCACVRVRSARVARN